MNKTQTENVNEKQIDGSANVLHLWYNKRRRRDTTIILRHKTRRDAINHVFIMQNINKLSLISHIVLCVYFIQQQIKPCLQFLAVGQIELILSGKELIGNTIQCIFHHQFVF